MTTRSCADKTARLLGAALATLENNEKFAGDKSANKRLPPFQRQLQKLPTEYNDRQLLGIKSICREYDRK